MTNDDNLADTIIPKSDQLNADDLLTGPITVTVEKVTRGDTKEQPVYLHIDGGRMPYKPCKSMRRVLIAAWGAKGSAWVGKRLTLYADMSVVFGGAKVGGIRISHVSDITDPLKMMLTTTRSKRNEYTVNPLIETAPITNKTITGIVEDVVTITVQNKPKWGIKINGETYGTFDRAIGEAAVNNKGESATLVWTTDGKYKTAISITQPADGADVHGVM